MFLHPFKTLRVSALSVYTQSVRNLTLRNIFLDAMMNGSLIAHNDIRKKRKKKEKKNVHQHDPHGSRLTGDRAARFHETFH